MILSLGNYIPSTVAIVSRDISDMILIRCPDKMLAGTGNGDVICTVGSSHLFSRWPIGAHVH
jgi:hypothetical protein